MTLGEKIKSARTQNGFSQEQLAEKMSVSRSAVAKWETDKGVPDIENLKLLASFLNVSIDYLIDEKKHHDEHIFKEAFSLSDCKSGNKRQKKDSIVFEKFKNSEIHPLLAKKKLVKSEKIIDNLLGFCTDTIFGVPDIINKLKNADKQFYLVEQDKKCFLVMVTDEFIETRRLDDSIDTKKFELDGWQFTKCTYKVK